MSYQDYHSSASWLRTTGLPVGLNTLTNIIRAAAKQSCPEDQVRYILANLSEVLKVDVCTLYSRQSDDSLVMIASHGLDKKHPITIPSGAGLVGKVLTGQHSINLVEPAQYPEYYHVPASNEEHLHSFCGVPVYSKGLISGVLVVQSYQPSLLDEHQEALLSTLAIHLGLLLDNAKVSTTKDVFTNHNLNSTVVGISGSQGIAIGQACVITANNLSEVIYQTDDAIEHNLENWKNLKAKALAAFCEERETINQALGENLSSLVDAYQHILNDPVFDQRIISEIETGCTLSWALKKTVADISALFRAIEDPYLQARHEDIEHLGDSLYRLWIEKEDSVPLDNSQPIVLIGQSISVSHIAQLMTKNLAAIVCTQGSALSHIAVFANALGIPSVLGASSLTLSNIQTIIVDGYSGEVIINPSASTINTYQKLIKDRQCITEEFKKYIKLPAQTLDGKQLNIMTNSGLNADLEPGLNNGAEGIGLYRSELPFMIRSRLPSEDEQFEIYQYVLKKYAGKPVYIRTLDIGSDKPLPYLPKIEEDNPALGLRGIRFSLSNLSLFDMQLRAILRASQANPQLHITFPMVSTSTQLNQALALLNSNLAMLHSQRLPIKRPKVGIMLEVPACTALLPLWRDKIDYISIGTNDLTQYLLAVDRNNALVNDDFDHLHPAVIHELLRIANLCREINLPFSICGELASMPEAIPYLIAIGCETLSLSASRIPLIKALVHHIDSTYAKQLLDEALNMDNAEAIRNASHQFLQGLNLPFIDLLEFH